MAEPTPGGETPPSPSAAERRSFPRRKPRGTATIRLTDSTLAPTIRVHLETISQGGASFTVAKELTVGQYIVVILQSPAVSVPLLTVRANVQWVAATEKPGQIRVGCAFQQRPSYADLIPFW